LKDDCFNQLTLKQSEKSINKEEVYCDEFDEILDTNDIQLKQLYADMKELITYEYMTVGLK
jgi:hypothetical protein